MKRWGYVVFALVLAIPLAMNAARIRDCYRLKR